MQRRLLIMHAKPGCVTNGRQEAALRRLGVEVDRKNLLSEPWSPQELRKYFDDLPLELWVNTSAPAVKRGEVAPTALGEEALLRRMVAEPILIRRPLLRVGEARSAGLDAGFVREHLGVELPADLGQDCARPSGSGAAAASRPVLAKKEPAP